MMSFQQSVGLLRWEPLLSSEDIIEWMQSRKKPRKLWRMRGNSQPIVYRFIFSEFVDENGRHTSCYIGEGGDFRRLSSHFSSPVNREKRSSGGQLILDKGWQVRGAVQNSGGKFLLESLHIDGSINLFGVTLNQQSLDDPFARRLLENWAILHAEYAENMHPLNRGISQSGKDLLRKLRASRKHRSWHATRDGDGM